MLIEIFCDKFKKNGVVRPAITFEKGLNVIEGDDGGTNSIGKSTFLMSIDFCFGGNDYVDVLKDVIKNVGHHTICFTFEFEKKYHFYRKTDEKEFVYITNEKYEHSDNKISIDKFTAFLKEKYEISLLDLSFRQVVSRFMRIYNRQNLNEILPLRSFNNETEHASITEMIKLYNLYGPLAELTKLSNEADEKYTTFGKAQEFRFLSSVTAKEYKANEKRIEELQNQAESLANRSEKGLLNLSAEKAEQITKLKDQIASLKRSRSKYFTQLNAFKSDSEYEVTSLKSDFSDLTKFFNNVNIENLTEIEDFHRKLSSILKREVTQSKKEIWSNINLLKEAIEELESNLAEIQQTTNISRVILKSYSSIEKEMDLLKKTNDNYVKKNELQKDAKEQEKLLIEKTAVQTAQLITTINSKMAEINTDYYLNETNAPILALNTPKKYIFETPDDQGTGCRYKGMITLDMAILLSSPLPVLTHDSIMYGNMSYKRVERTFNLYNNSDKQIFVAVDKATNLNPETRKIIDTHRRLLLSTNGNELFGWYWGAPKEVKL